MAELWMALTKADLKIELAECQDEGKDLSALEADFKALDVAELDDDNPRLRQKAGKLLDKTQRLPLRPDYAFSEPSRLGDIRKQRPPGPASALAGLKDHARAQDKIHGAWLGRCCGCALGKPAEGRKRSAIENYLNSQNQWPLIFYFSGQADAKVREECQMPKADYACYRENLKFMPEDDDTNYTTIGLAVLRQRGADFEPAHVANFWLGNLPFYHTCTAERVAYRNLVMILPVPDRKGKFKGRFSCATFRNPYREWIGAQIRADFFGYCNPGNPSRAAEFAWRDAAISHVKNGIYGAMWVAAMLAAAFVSDDIETVIRAGLEQIPERCRLRADIEQVFQWRRSGLSYVQAVDALHARWQEGFGHHWCHTNSNAQVVALALLWGEKDFGRTICAAVMPGFDTDCNGATAGSVLGLMLGRQALPDNWTAPLNDTLRTGVHGYHEVTLADLTAKTLEVISAIE